MGIGNVRTSSLDATSRVASSDATASPAAVVGRLATELARARAEIDAHELHAPQRSLLPAHTDDGVARAAVRKQSEPDHLARERDGARLSGALRVPDRRAPCETTAVELAGASANASISASDPNAETAGGRPSIGRNSSAAASTPTVTASAIDRGRAGREE